MREAGLYIHIPFCHAKCSYCDFVAFANQENQIGRYMDALVKEISFHKGTSVRTLFIGGGTPTVLSPGHIERLFSALQQNMNLRFLTEATVEANPESADEETLKAYRRGGVNRLSFGLQTTENSILARLGRLHDRDGFYNGYKAARRWGFDNVNVDLIFGLPGQTLESWSKTLDEIIALSPEHVSAYALKIEPGTPLARERIPWDDDLQADMYLSASEKLDRAGYSHYEISNFSKPGRESQHNLMYWENAETIGLGVSAASYIFGKRMKNPSQMAAYIQSCLEDRSPAVVEAELDADQTRKESVMLRLRLKKGAEASVVKRVAGPVADEFMERGLAFVKNDQYALTPQGWLLSNALFQTFL